MKGVKALVIQMPYETDIHNVISVARAEAMKIFKNAHKIRVVDILKWYPHGWIAVVQNEEGRILVDLKNK